MYENKSKISLSLITLGLCAVAYASEYKTPQVGFKDRAAPSKEMKVADLGDHYKVEKDLQSNDRQIASEVEESDREPSSIVAKEKKKAKEHEEMLEEPKDAPKPWLYRNEALRNN